MAGRTIVSVTPDLALEAGNTYAGGLGVLEGDKFYAAAKIGLDYRVLTLLYGNGYVDYELDAEGNPVPRPQPQPEEFLRSLRVGDEFKVRVRGEEVSVQALELAEGSARAVFFSPTSPEWAVRAAERLYIEEGPEQGFLKYVLLARASEAYIRRDVGLDSVAFVDLQEAYTALLPLSLRLPGKYRMVVHTAGPWGHPTFPREYFASEYGYSFAEEKVPLTEIGLSLARQAFAVSAKHMDVLSRVFPHHSWKMGYVTNGVNLDRWMDAEARSRYEDLNLDRFISLRERLRRSLVDLIARYKDVDPGRRMIVVWARRLAPYKRPEFAARLASELGDAPLFFVLGGKPHPRDGAGLEAMRLFARLHRERENVVYVPNYGIREAKVILGGGDVLLFTPFSGWEACGTSYMKAGVNGVPSIASRDGGALEFIVDGVNGWFFGEDLRNMVDYGGEEGRRISEAEYAQLRDALLRVHRMYSEDPESFHRVGLNALRSFATRASMERVLREYYPELLGLAARPHAPAFTSNSLSCSDRRLLASSPSPSSSATSRQTFTLYMHPGSGPITSPVYP